MKVTLGSEQHAKEVMGQLVTHQGKRIGHVTEIRHNIPNGRRYAFVRPLDPTHQERRIPLDELTYWE